MIIADVGLLIISYSIFDTLKVKPDPPRISDLNKF